MEIKVKRLAADNLSQARDLFALMATVFQEEYQFLSDDYLKTLLSRSDFWALASFSGNGMLGGLTAHVIPMTRTEASEVFIYDIAVLAAHQRRGIGTHLVSQLSTWTAREGAAETFVLAEDGDTHALDFYRGLGGKPSSVTLFNFRAEDGGQHSA